MDGRRKYRCNNRLLAEIGLDVTSYDRGPAVSYCAANYIRDPGTGYSCTEIN